MPNIRIRSVAEVAVEGPSAKKSYVKDIFKSIELRIGVSAQMN